MNTTKSVGRLAAYIERRKKSRGIDIDHIHGFDAGLDSGFELLLSDIDALIASERRLQADLEVLARALTDAQSLCRHQGAAIGVLKRRLAMMQEDVFKKIEGAAA